MRILSVASCSSPDDPCPFLPPHKSKPQQIKQLQFKNKSELDSDDEDAFNIDSVESASSPSKRLGSPKVSFDIGGDVSPIMDEGAFITHGSKNQKQSSLASHDSGVELLLELEEPELEELPIEIEGEMTAKVVFDSPPDRSKPSILKTSFSSSTENM